MRCFTVMDHAEANRNDVQHHLHAWLILANIIRNAYYALNPGN